MAVLFTAERAEAVDAVDRAAYPTASFTPSNNCLLVAIAGSVHSAAGYTMSSMTDSGPGLTWNQHRVDVVTITSFYRLEIRWAWVRVASAMVLTATYDTTIQGCDLWVGEWSGADPGNPIRSNSVSASNASGVDPAATLSSAPLAGSTVVTCALCRRNPPNFTPEAGWTEEMDNGVSTPVIGQNVWRVTTGSDQAFTSTGTDAQNLTTIFEIVAADALPAELRRSRRRTLVAM